MIYLAGPYAHSDLNIMEGRYFALTWYAAKLMMDGQCVYSPITHNHFISARYDLPRDWDFWKKMDLPILAKCSKMIVYQLPGWTTSRGVKAETQFASQIMPIEYHEVHPEMPSFELGPIVKNKVYL